MNAGLKIRDAGGTLRAIRGIRARDSGGTLRTLSEIKMRDKSNVLRTVWKAMETTVTPASVSKSGGNKTGDPKPFTSPIVTATVDGGIAPLTYAWARISGSAVIDADAPTAAATTFSGTLDPGEYSAVFEVTVTDNLGAKSRAQVSVYFNYILIT